MLESFQKRALNIGIRPKCRFQYTHSDVCRSWERRQANCHLASSLLSVDGLIKLRMQRVFIGALCRQMSSCNQSERYAIFGRDSYERKLSNHHDQGRRQGATAIIEFFSVTHTSKNFRRGQGAPVFVEGGRLCHDTMASPSLQYQYRA